MKKKYKIRTKKSLFRRQAFFYRGILVVKAAWVVNLMQIISLTSEKNRIEGTSFFPFVFFVRSNRNFTHYFLTHEVIHARQSLECACLGVLFSLALGLPGGWGIALFFSSFAFTYTLSYLVLRIFFSHHHTYLLLFFEQEAWLNEGDRDYLHRRASFAWVLILIQSIRGLRSRSYRESLLEKILEIRTKRKKHFNMMKKLQLHEKQSF